MVRYGFILAIVLGAYWLSLSGYFIPLILTLGGISILLVLGLCKRMNILDAETAPYLFSLQMLSYFTWLFVEIVKANMAVIKAVLDPDMEISPKLVKIPMRHKSDVGRSFFANSITLTPGTVSVEVFDRSIYVHALLAEMSEPKGFKEMETRSAFATGDPAYDPTKRDVRS